MPRQQLAGLRRSANQPVARRPARAVDGGSAPLGYVRSAGSEWRSPCGRCRGCEGRATCSSADGELLRGHREGRPTIRRALQGSAISLLGSARRSPATRHHRRHLAPSGELGPSPCPQRVGGGPGHGRSPRPPAGRASRRRSAAREPAVRPGLAAETASSSRRSWDRCLVDAAAVGAAPPGGPSVPRRARSIRPERATLISQLGSACGRSPSELVDESDPYVLGRGPRPGYGRRRTAGASSRTPTRGAGGRTRYRSSVDIAACAHDGWVFPDALINEHTR